MRRAVGIGMAAILLVIAFVSPASAQPIWCEDDPVFIIDGQLFTVTTRFAISELTSSTVVSYALSVSPDATVQWYHPAAVPGTPIVKSEVLPISTSAKRNGFARLVVSVSGNHSFDIIVNVTGAATITKKGSSVGTTVHLRTSAPDRDDQDDHEESSDGPKVDLGRRG